jgi:hypothetical protein
MTRPGERETLAEALTDVLYRQTNNGDEPSPDIADYYEFIAMQVLAALDAAQPAEDGLDVERLADVLTALHLRWDQICTESHLTDAVWVAAEYARLASTRPSTEPETSDGE